MARKRLGDLLIEAGLIDDMKLRGALAEQRKFGRPLGRVLIDMKMVSEDAVVDVLSQQLHIPAVQIRGKPIDRIALDMLDQEFCERHSCLPFAYQENGKFLDVALSDPTNPETFDQIRVKTRCNVRPYLAGPLSLERAIHEAFGGVRSIEYSPSPFAPPHERMVDLGGPPPGVDLGGNMGAALYDTAEVPGAQAAPTIQRAVTGPTQRAAPRPGQYAVGGQPAAGEIRALRAEIKELRALLERDERVLRRLMGLLIEKGLVGRDELMKRMTE